MRNLIEISLLLLLALLPCLVFAGRPLVMSDEPLTSGDYNLILDSLAHNRECYNKINDSILIKTNRNQWIKHFRNRANAFGIIHNNDKKMIAILKNDIQKYALADSALYRNDASHDDLMCSKSMFFISKCHTMMKNNSIDPFLVKDLAKPICDLMFRKMPESPASLQAANLMLRCYWQMWKLDMTQYSDSIVTYCDKHFAFEDRLESLTIVEQAYIILAYAYIFNYKHLDVDKVLPKYYERFKALIHDPKHQQYFQTEDGKKFYSTALKINNTAQHNLLRNCYMPLQWDKHTAFSDSLARVQLERNLKSSPANAAALSNVSLYKVYLGMETFDESFAKFHNLYSSRLIPPSKYISVDSLTRFTNPILNLIYLLDRSSLSEKAKHDYTKLYANSVLEIVKRCRDNQTNNIRNSIVYNFITYKRMIRNLNPEENEEFIRAMLAYTQVQTYAHTLSVANMCMVLTDEVISSRPNLLVGIFGTRSTEEVRKSRRKILEFMENAALYHDIGKLSMSELVKNDYRPLTDDEFGIIKQHPERGAKILEAAGSSLNTYHDFVLGHHKWYDGKGGYPSNYDNTKSQYRILVDVLTICDCLDAATDRVGRNYAYKKSFATVISEFNDQAGTRYNPDLVKLINTSPKTYSNLKKIVEGGWVEVYYNIYKNYFEH